MKINKLLVLDDDSINNFLTQEILSQYVGLQSYKIFDNGYEVLEYLNSCTPNEFPDLLLIDLKMPEMDGFEFLRTYQNSFGHKNAAIVILTNSTLGKDKNKVSEYSVVKDYLRKPLSEDDLKALITKLENKVPYINNK